MALESAKVTISLIVSAVVEVTDEGYLGVGSTVQQHIAKAREDANRWQWLVQKGTSKPEAIRATTKVNSVTIVPKES